MVGARASLAGRNRGGHGLIKDGAALVESRGRDVLDVLAPAARAAVARPDALPHAGAARRDRGPPAC